MSAKKLVRNTEITVFGLVYGFPEREDNLG